MRGWEGACPLLTPPNSGGVDGGDTAGRGGRGRGGTASLHSHGQRGLDAVVHQQLGQHGLQVLLGALPAEAPGSASPPPTEQPPPPPAGAMGSPSCPPQELCLLSSPSRTSNAAGYDPDPPPRSHQAKEGPPSLRGPSSRSIPGPSSRSIPTHPGDTHVDRSSHTEISRVSSMIPMASKVMISSSCSAEGPWNNSAGPPSSATRAPKKGRGRRTHPLVPLKRVAQFAQHRLRKGTGSALGRGRG